MVGKLDIPQLATDCHQVFAEMVHDLMNLACGIRTYADLIEREGGLSDQARRRLHGIGEAGGMMEEILENTLEKVVHHTVRRGWIDLDWLVRKVCDASALAARAKNVRLKVNSEPVRVWGNETELGQVVTNLLSNAIKFSFPGGKVTLSCHATKDAVRLSVRDSGIGIPKAMLPDLFTAPHTGRRGTAGEESHGLGLAICRLIVADHEGTIRVQSRPGRGTTFAVLFPRKGDAPVAIADSIDDAALPGLPGQSARPASTTVAA